jgi:IclR family transcriptional regulator, KDG regulon repressor
LALFFAFSCIFFLTKVFNSDKFHLQLLRSLCHYSKMAISQSLAHGLDILFLYDTTASLLSVSEISKRLGLSQSKTYRLVRTLIQYGLLQEKPGTAQYQLGLSAYRIGLLAQQCFDLPGLARPLMKELSQLTRETVLLTAVNGTKGVVLERVESEEPIRYSLFQPGASLPLHSGASSKVLMAFLPEKEWDRVIEKEGLRRYTVRTVTDPDELKVQLREIQKKGYAVSDQEVDRDVRAVAAPVFNGKGELVAGLSVAGPLYRITKGKMNSFAKWVVQYAGKISSQLGYVASSLPKGRPVARAKPS